MASKWFESPTSTVYITGKILPVSWCNHLEMGETMTNLATENFVPDD
jgi:hypothetical protein